VAKYLGELNVRPKNSSEAAGLVGKAVQFLRGSDFDRPKPGAYRASIGIVTGHSDQGLRISGQEVPVNSICELIVIRDATSNEMEGYR